MSSGERIPSRKRTCDVAALEESDFVILIFLFGGRFCFGTRFGCRFKILNDRFAVISSNDLETSDRYPQLRGYQARAKAKSTPTPETDAFLSSVPDGTPLPGFTKRRSNLVSMYRFNSGPVKGFSIGGGVQYRDKSYMGNFDLNQDGVAEELWSSGYNLWNLMMGYRTKIMKRNVDMSLNIYNLFDKDYFRSFALSTGGWGDGRNFRFAARVDF